MRDRSELPRVTSPGAPPGESSAVQLGARLKWVVGARAGILGLLGIATLAVFREGPGAPTPRLLLWGIATCLAASIVYAVWLRLGRALVLLAGLQMFVDLLFWSAVVYLTGGAESAFSVLFHLSTIVGAFLFGSRGAWMTAGSGAVLFGATALMLREGIVVPPSDLTVVTALSVREVAYYLVVNTAGLGVVAALAGHLAERERRAGGKLEEARRTSADLAALNDDIVRSLTSGLAATDEHGAILWMNPAGAEMLGRSPSSLVGLELERVIPVDGGLPPSGTGRRWETVATRPTGGSVPIGYRIAPLLDGEGTERGFLVVFQDLSELRTMREKVERAERLAGLGRLAAGLAHELRNPLGSISGSLEMLKDSSGLSGDDRLLADIVVREVDRLDGLVAQMLELAKPKPPDRVLTDLVALARDVVRVLGSSAEAEDLGLELEAPEELTVAVDPHQVRQLLWNLIRNAAQATAVGGRVVLRLERRSGAVVIEVEDSGQGVAAADRERIFEPFYSTKRGGIGMGLAVCRQVAEGHGGSITVARGAAGGALFSVVLGLDPSTEPTPKPA